MKKVSIAPAAKRAPQNVFDALGDASDEDD